MALPGIPTNFICRQANAEVLVSWNLSAGATSYSVLRSTDQINYSSIATPTETQYLDTSVVIGTQYWYKVASVNGSGTGVYTPAQSVVPVNTGEMCLSQIRLASQQRADRVNSQFVTQAEWDSYINQSMFELYDLLVTVYEDYYVAPPLSFTVNGTDTLFPLPNGTNYDGAKPLYKLIGVDLALNNATNAYVTVNKFNFIDRNKFVYPNTASTIYGVFNCQYRMLGSNIELIPAPSGNQVFRLWYVPRLRQLLKDTDITDVGISGWIEYIITDAAIKALQKEESDVSVLAAQKIMLIKRIQDSANNRDAGQPDTISDVRNGGWGGNWFSGGNRGIGGW